jgi:hypothetical protein
MPLHKIQAQKTLWVETFIEAATEEEALEIAQGHFAVEWQDTNDTEQFSGVFWTEEQGLIDDPIDEIARLNAIIKRMKNEFNIPDEDWNN